MIQAGTIRTGSAWTLVRRGPVLDQLHQMIAIDHLARRRGDILADDDSHCRSPSDCVAASREILKKIFQAAQEIGAALALRAVDHHRIEPGQIRGREGVEIFEREEGDARRVLGRMPRSSRVALLHQCALGEERLFDKR